MHTESIVKNHIGSITMGLYIMYLKPFTVVSSVALETMPIPELNRLLKVAGYGKFWVTCGS